MDDDPQQNRLGPFVTDRRHELRLSLRATAERAEMNPGALYRIETSERRINVSRDVLVRLARALEVELAVLITEQSVARDDLPELNVYLRAKYDMDDVDIAQMAAYLKRYRGEVNGPADGEDER